MQHSARARAAFAFAFVIATLGVGLGRWFLREREEPSAPSASAALAPGGASPRGDRSELPTAPLPTAPLPTAPQAPAPSTAPRADGAGPRFDRARADALRERAALRRAAEQRAAKQRAAEHARGLAAAESTRAGEASPPMTPEEEERRREFIRQAVREQYFPVARSCYQELLDRDPEAAGKVIMSFTIAGVGDAGVVDRVELGDETTMDDPEFTQCMRESMYSTVFEPPPSGATETTVVYPIELHP